MFVCVELVHCDMGISDVLSKGSFDVGLSKKEYSQVLSIRDRKNDVYFIANNLQQPAHIFTSISVKWEMCTSELERKTI